MGNAVAGIVAIVGFVIGILVVGNSFDVPTSVGGYVFFGGIMLITLSIGGPIFVLDKLD
ncbi:hypothetical protein [uncultured Amnibacterium sp.]|uniref:hypothetical protein n=1 Tax=uncultured Amnibacterium sp. TaxID=1631851 RepID=UPI0035CBC87D